MHAPVGGVAMAVPELAGARFSNAGVSREQRDLNLIILFTSRESAACRLLGSYRQFAKYPHYTNGLASRSRTSLLRRHSDILANGERL